MNRDLLQALGLPRGLGRYRGELHERRIRNVLDAVAERELLAIIGPFGSGKTELVDMAARECDGYVPGQ